MTTVEFQTECLKNAALPEPKDAAGIIDAYVLARSVALSKAREIGVGDEGMGSVKQKLACAFVRQWMMLRHAALDISFAGKKQWAHVERDPAGVKLIGVYRERPQVEEDPVLRLVTKVPVFFTATSDVKSFAFDGSDLRIPSHSIGMLSSGRRKGESYRGLNIQLHAKMPDGISEGHQKLARSAYSHLSLAGSVLYSRGVRLRSEYENRKNRYGDGDDAAAMVLVIWAPEESSLSVTSEVIRPVGDPAIIFAVAGHNFLLDFYDTPDERPIEHLIREFSEGRLPK